MVNRNSMLSGVIHFPPDRPMAQTFKEEGVDVKDVQVVEFDRVFLDSMTEL